VCLSYLLQLLDDRNGNRQLTDIFTFPCVCRRRLVCLLTVFSNKYILRHNVSHLGLFYNQRTEREMCGFISSGKCSTRVSSLGSGPSTALANSQIPSTKQYRSRVEGTIATFAHAPSCNVFTPSRTPDQTLK
jgi:hypothetical protein